MNNIMLDLETLGTEPGCPIISIGAARFDESGIGGCFYRAITVDSCFALGMKPAAATLEWWMGQSDSAKRVFSGERILINQALLDFKGWVEDDDAMWGNSARFDCGILHEAYRICGIQTPWKWWNEKCYRTLKNTFPSIEFERTGVHHNALDDAKSQAWHAAKILKFIRCIE